MEIHGLEISEKTKLLRFNIQPQASIRSPLILLNSIPYVNVIPKTIFFFIWNWVLQFLFSSSLPKFHLMSWVNGSQWFQPTSNYILFVMYRLQCLYFCQDERSDQMFPSFLYSCLDVGHNSIVVEWKLSLFLLHNSK